MNKPHGSDAFRAAVTQEQFLTVLPRDEAVRRFGQCWPTRFPKTRSSSRHLKMQ